MSGWTAWNEDADAVPALNEVGQPLKKHRQLVEGVPHVIELSRHRHLLRRPGIYGGGILRAGVYQEILKVSTRRADQSVVRESGAAHGDSGVQ